MRLPIFSVIIPCHNEEIYIGETIESVLNQTFSNFEIIIVNDNSQDKTKKIALNYVKSDKRIKLINVQKGSAAGARNAGAKLAKGKYLLFQDADCIADKNLLQNALPYFDHCSGVATRTDAAEPKSWAQRAVAAQRATRWENKLKEAKILGPGIDINVAMMKKKVFDALGGFNEEIFYFEDNDLTKRFFECGFVAIFAPNVIQYHHDPLTLRESFGQCRSIAKGMHSKLKSGQKVSLMEWVNLFAGVIDFIIPLPSIVFAAVFLRTLIKSRDLVGSFYFGVLWVLRSIAKLWYFLTGWF